MIDTKQKLVEFMRDNPGIIVCRSTEEVNEMLRLIEQTNNPAYSNAYKYVRDDSFVYFRLDARAYEEYLCYGSHEYVAEQFPRENWFEFREIVSYKPVSLMDFLSSTEVESCSQV